MDNLDNDKITYRAGEVVLQKGGSNINYTYSPNNNAKSTYTVAYEYSFENTMNKAVAINLKSIDKTGVTVSYVYSDSKLDLTSDIESETTFKLQQLPNKGDEVYIYVLVSPTNTSIPTTFTTSIVWYYGLPQELIIEGANGTSTTKTIVNGQELSANDIPQPTAPEGYYFDSYFLDKEYTKLAGDNFRVGKTLYARFANLPSDWINWDNSNSTYYITKGSTSLSDYLIMPTIYNDGTNGKAYVTYIETASVYTNGVFFHTKIFDVKLPLKLKVVGYGAFGDCTNLHTINIPNSVTTIQGEAFHYCINLTSITIPKSVTTIENSAFNFCYSLAEVYNLSNLTISIGSSTNGSLGLFAKVIHNNKNIISVLQVINNIVYYPQSNNEYIALAPAIDRRIIDCLIFDSRTIQIINSAFYDAYNVSTIDLGCCNKLNYIGNMAFRGTNIISITIPNTVNKIDAQAFQFCNKLTSITFEFDEGEDGTNCWYYTSNGTDFDNMENGTLVDLTNSSTNATYFRSTYVSYYWYKK